MYVQAFKSWDKTDSPDVLATKKALTGELESFSITGVTTETQEMFSRPHVRELTEKVEASYDIEPQQKCTPAFFVWPYTELDKSLS